MKLIKQGFSFILISGVGWIIDFAVYMVLTSVCNFPVLYANMISAIPSVTFVFFTSTRKVFQEKESKVKLGYKYLIYFAYQLVLLFIISFVAQLAYDYVLQANWLQEGFLLDNLKMVIKILITPITMTINFLVMKLLIERI